MDRSRIGRDACNSRDYRDSRHSCKTCDAGREAAP